MKNSPAPRQSALPVPAGQNEATAKRRAALRLALPALLCGAIGVFSSCASDPESHLVTAPPPPSPTLSVGNPQQVVVTTPTTTTTTVPVAVATTSNGAVVPVATTTNSMIVVQAPPAPPPPEAIPDRPSQYHLWVPGYWTWRTSRYEWMSGHWEVPPTTGARWHAPRWEPENGSYRFYEGYWR